MFIFLRKLFIKNYKNVEDENVRVAHGKLASIVGIVVNVILVALKITFGIIASSIAIIADALNNLSDVSSSLVTLIGFKMSNKPADKEHPFGHQRIEYIAGLIVSIIIIAIAVLLLSQSIERIISQETSSYDLWTFIILGVSILLKLLQFAIYFSFSKVISSVALKATAYDSLGDILATTLLLAGALVSYYTGLNLDGYLGIIIAIFVMVAGIRLVKETSSPLIGESIKKDIVNKIVLDISAYNGVLGVHDVLCHAYGPRKIFMSIHVEVDGNVNIFISHDLIDKIEKDIKKKYDIDLLIHLDPIDLNDVETNVLEKDVKSILKELDASLNVHEFRIVKMNEAQKIVFELLYPYDSKCSENQVKEVLTKKMLELHPGNNFIYDISFERPYYEE